MLRYKGMARTTEKHIVIACTLNFLSVNQQAGMAKTSENKLPSYQGAIVCLQTFAKCVRMLYQQSNPLHSARAMAPHLAIHTQILEFDA